MLVCFFSVQHFAAKKQGVHFSLKVILLTIFSDKGVVAESLSCPKCLLCPFDILLAHAVHRWISFIGNENSAYVFMSSGQLRWDFYGHLKKSFSSELKCLHYSNTNGRNYNIIIIIIIIIHLGLSSVQYNNKQNPFFQDIAFGDTPQCKVCIFT